MTLPKSLKPSDGWSIKTFHQFIPGRAARSAVQTSTHSCPDRLSPCLTKETWNELPSLLGTHMHTHTQNTRWFQQRNQINARFIPTAVWVTECPSVSVVLSTNGSFCTFMYSGTKGQLKGVCVRRLQHSSALFPKAFTYKSRVGDTLVAAKSNKHTKKTESCFTQRPWESFWPLPEVRGGEGRGEV